MTQASSQAWAFYRDVAKNRKMWTIYDSGGYPAPLTSEGRRAQPFWSSITRAQRIIKTVPAYAGFTTEEITWETFCKTIVPDLTNDGLLVGINWSGPRALGYDMEPKRLQECVEAIIEENQGRPNQAL